MKRQGVKPAGHAVVPGRRTVNFYLQADVRCPALT